METLIFIAIAVVITIIQKKIEKAKEDQQNRIPPSQQYKREEPNEYEQQESQGHNPPRSLQDLIRQFENAQQQAAQGNIEPATPPVNKSRVLQSKEAVSLRYIAEVVIQVDFINLEFLMETFGVDENRAAQMLSALQKHRIVGRDMGEGDCDVLVHDLEELDNLLNREKQAEEKRIQQEKEARLKAERERIDARRRELERQRELNELEDRAKSARESAAAITDLGTAATDTPAVPARKSAVSVKNIADVRKGFIWAKVLDEPRFKKRWSAQYR
jgi:hypothetical protein